MADLTPHIVHLKAPTYHVERRKTFDPARGDAKTPDGTDQPAPVRRINPETLEVETFVPDPIPYWGFDEQVQDVPPPNDCPDCGRGLSSVGNFMCLRLVEAIRHDYYRGVLPKDEHAHQCIVACGGKPGDPLYP